MKALARALLGTSLLMTPLFAAATPALAECSSNPNRWPEFEKVAPTAKRVVVGRVTEPPDTDWRALGGREFLTVFTVEVEDVLKGSAPATIEVNGLYSGLPRRGERSCRVNSSLYAKPGDRIAIAFGGKLNSVQGRVNSAVWIEGRPNNEISNPGLGTMGLDEVREVMGLEPVPSFLAFLSGASGSIDGQTLVLDGVASVAYFSDQPDRLAGLWDLGAFANAWDPGHDSLASDPPTAVLSILGNEDPEELVLELNGIEADDGTVRLDFTVIEGTPPTGILGPASLLVEIAADVERWSVETLAVGPR